MRWSRTLIPTLKEAPADAVVRSHRLMMRAGLIRPVGSGSYSYLPLGVRVLHRVAAIVREEMDAAGALEVLMPVLWPEGLMDSTGRLEAFGDDLFRFADRHGRPHVLAPTHEETATALVRDEVKSYRQLPLTLYQVQTKFRDEPRPRFGALRTREFIMKDAYSFSASPECLDGCYDRMRGAYERIFARCGLSCVVVEADPGAMGGEESHEFIVPAEAGSVRYVRCPACGYAANAEVARAPAPPAPTVNGPEPELRAVETPGQTTIAQVSEFLDVPPERMVKTIIYEADGRPVAALVRGDHAVNETKLRAELRADALAPAGAELVERVTGAPVGFAGPVGLAGVEIICDPAASAVRGAVTGANRADAHLVGVVPGRDFVPAREADIRLVAEGEPCGRCGGPARVQCGIEVGHTFKLGTKYSKALKARLLDAEGRQRPYVMGCYGLGINRIAAALVETLCDEDGIVWPPEAAPYQVLVMPLDMSEGRIVDAALDAYERLRGCGLDVLLDDRSERPGAKFHDADLVGFPIRVVVGKGYLKAGSLEVQVRRDGSRHDAPPADLVSCVRERLAALCESAVAGAQPAGA